MATNSTPKISDLVIAAYLEKNASKAVVTGFKKSKGIKQANLEEYDYLQDMLDLSDLCNEMKNSLKAQEDENQPDNVALAEEEEVTNETVNEKGGDEPEKLRRMSPKLEAQEDENNPLNVAMAEEKEVTNETVNKNSGDDEEKLRGMSPKLNAQEKMIRALLEAQTTENKVKAEPTPMWDHPAQREPLLVKMSWEQITLNITEQYQEVAQEVANNEDFGDLLVLDQNVEDSGIASDIICQYFHLLEKVSFEKKVMTVRPFTFMSEPVRRKNGIILKHKLSLKDYEDSLPQRCFENVDLIFGLVVMDLDWTIPHFSLLVIDLYKSEIRHYCSMLELLDTTNLRKYLKKKTKKNFKHLDVAMANHQYDSYDCGIFVCQNAKQEALQISSDPISQDNMICFKKMMLMELTKNLVFQWNE